MRHAANMAKAITENVNPGQPVVITADQPVYALGKKLQWIFQDEFRDFVWMLGPLHIEQNFIKAIGDWLEGSGWTKICEYSSNTLPGKADNFLSCAGVKESRGLGMHIRCHWFHLSLLLMKFFTHNLNSGIINTGKKI